MLIRGNLASLVKHFKLLFLVTAEGIDEDY